MALRPCLDCGKLSPHSRCPIHRQARERARDQRRGTAAARGYDSGWQKLVVQAIDLHPWCSDCGIDRQQAKATDNPLTGDHQRWPAETTSDIEVVCRRCNSIRGPRRHRIF